MEVQEVSDGDSGSIGLETSDTSVDVATTGLAGENGSVTVAIVVLDEEAAAPLVGDEGDEIRCAIQISRQSLLRLAHPFSSPSVVPSFCFIPSRRFT